MFKRRKWCVKFLYKNSEGAVCKTETQEFMARTFWGVRRECQDYIRMMYEGYGAYDTEEPYTVWVEISAKNPLYLGVT